MSRVAVMTIGILRAPYGDPQVQGFWDRVPSTFATAETSRGFVARLSLDDGADIKIEQEPRKAKPLRFQDNAFDGRTPETFSLWQDLESLFAFTYRSFHGDVFKQRKAWTVHGSWPSYVVWWVQDDHTPSPKEALERYEHLDRAGPSPEAFDFKHPFGPDGQVVELDRAKVRALAQENSEKSRS